METDEQIKPLDIPIVNKHIELNTAEIAFVIEILQRNINFAPEENTQNEIDLTTNILKKLIK